MKKSVLRWVSRIMFLIGAASLGWYGYVFISSWVVQIQENSRLDRMVIEPESSNARLKAAAVSAGGLIGRIEVPRIGLSSIVLQGVEDRTLRLGAGHIEGTAIPGEPGNVALAGHRDTVFRPLRNIQAGDEIRLKTIDGVFEYLVDWARIVGPEDVSVLDAEGGEHTLTLVTCYPFNYIGSAPDRFVVRAHLLTLEVASPGKGP